MPALYKSFRRALSTHDGDQLSAVFSPENPDLKQYAYSANHASIRHAIEYELSKMTMLREERPFNAWTDTLACLWKLAYTLERDDETEMSWPKVYERQKDLALAIVRGFTNGDWPSWVMPVLLTTCKFLRLIAIKSDEQSQKADKSSEHLEDTARHINRMFTLCISDRAPLETSRKWGTYSVINMLFKTYFRLNSIMLSKNILRALRASSGDMPPLDEFPKSDVVTFKYYCGVISFLEEDYATAEESLSTALDLCKSDATRNQELILTYLIPTTLLKSHKLPSLALLSRHPRLESLFSPLRKAIKSGNLQAFDDALSGGESEFVKRKIYLTLGRCRDIAMRNLFRRVYLIGNKKTRVSVRDFQIAMGCTGHSPDGDKAEVNTVLPRDPPRVEVEVEEAECMLANMIYKGLMKGYISREKQMVVLSASEAFPGTGV